MVVARELERLGLGVDGCAMRQGGPVFAEEGEMVCINVVTRYIRGNGGMGKCHFVRQRHWWHVAFLLLVEALVVCSNVVVVCCSRCRGGVLCFCKCLMQQRH